jgi:hypothetical protein
MALPVRFLSRLADRPHKRKFRKISFEKLI